jgi:hypothetical protein
MKDEDYGFKAPSSANNPSKRTANRKHNGARRASRQVSPARLSVTALPDAAPPLARPSLPFFPSFTCYLPQASLAELVRDSGGLLPLSSGSDSDEHEFFRDVIRQGYLSKLPPVRNRIQAWRRRYFRLVIALNRSMAGGPVFLEYYSDHNKKRPKVRRQASRGKGGDSRGRG